jgi:hypothetical protein
MCSSPPHFATSTVCIAVDWHSVCTITSERQTMNFTQKINVRPAISGILTIAAVAVIGWVSHAVPAPVSAVATQNALAGQESFQTGDTVPIIPAVELAPASRLQTTGLESYQPISTTSTTHQNTTHQKKHWLKRNAPIVGGAAGGALIGGLAGGGPGLLIGGAAGGGGGYLYKRLRHHHHYYHHND